LASDPTWWEVAATPEAGPTPGFRRWSFALSDHLFGPATPGQDELGIELVAFVRTADGGRIFDHNAHPGDFVNTRLDASNGFAADDADVCRPEVGTLWFDEWWNETLSGSLRQGGYLELRYDIDRLPHCRGTHNGYPAWDLEAHVRFLPGGQLATGSVRRHVTVNGTPTNEAVDLPLAVRIPEDAWSVEIWFRNFSGAGSSCEAWDSNDGTNYRFEVWPAADHPRCRDVERETGARTEDYRMAHNQAACLSYDLEAQHDAGHCEFHVEGFGDGYVGHYGIPFHWLLAYLRVGPQDGEVLSAGLFTRFRDNRTGLAEQRFSLGIREADGLWRTGLAYLVGMGSAACDRTIEEFAFFLDVRRPSGEVVRLWQSRHGANYRWDDAFALPTSREYIAYGSIQWADAASGVFDSRQACR
ncbi:MAG: hypothetical protein JXB32_10455, partial [Deltaproteobacteria bacterium]|nr:hypothetical protein [Deltaproteobacteria bacterium]